VINEDRVDPNEGFGTHPHREFEIFSYIVKGELEHRDSMGNLEIMKRGDLQMTSAGTGIRHSEYNRHTSKPVHFLQVRFLSSVRERVSLSSLFRCSRSLTLALDSCAFRQIWALPNESGLKPTYYTRHFTDDEKKAGLVRVVAPVGGKGVSEEREVAGPAPVRLPLSLPQSSPSSSLRS
jgi:hypothetical protein